MKEKIGTRGEKVATDYSMMFPMRFQNSSAQGFFTCAAPDQQYDSYLGPVRNTDSGTLPDPLNEKFGGRPQ